MHFDWERLTDSVHRCRLTFLDVTVGLVQGRTGTLLIDSGTTLIESRAIDADSDVAAWPDTLDLLLAAGGLDAVYVPGHGSVVDAEFVRRQQDWLRSHRRKR